MIELRLATEADYPDVLRMSKAFHESSPYSHYPMNETKVRAIFDTYLKDPSSVIVVVAYKEDIAIGCIVAVRTELYFSDVVTAGEIIWYVQETFRKTRAGLLLYKAFEEWGRRVGARVLQGVNTEGTTDLVRYYSHKKYSKAETVYIKEI